MKLAEMRERKKLNGKRTPVKFSWLYDREVALPELGMSKTRLKSAAVLHST